MHRELAGGKGFADIVFIPRKKFQDKPRNANYLDIVDV